MKVDINYLAPSKGEAISTIFSPNENAIPSHLFTDPHSQVMSNARLVNATLDTYGFQLYDHPSKFSNFDDEVLVTGAAYSEVERLVQDHTGARKVLAFHHMIRKRHPGDKAEVAGPLTCAHVDITGAHASDRIRKFLPFEANKLLQRRWQVLSIWRPITGPVEDCPLALCNGSTAKQDDLVRLDTVYHNNRHIGKIYGTVYNSEHMWYYYPKMMPNEVVFIKLFDSDKSVKARFSPHCAFHDPETPANPVPRESIEIRVFVFY